MPEQSYRVFISYSRANEDRKKRLVTHLSTLRAEGLVSVWHDRCIEAGDLWREELDQAMREAEVALFLVSADFIASPFCQDVEVPELLRRHREEGVLIVPVIVDYCEWGHIERLSQFQALPEGGKPVPALRPQDKAWTQVVAGLRRRLTEKPPAKRLPAVAVAPGESRRPAAFSLENLLLRLPGETGDLFGREEALGWLDAAYTDAGVGVLALVGFGGVGKSALVRHWVERRFRAADRAPRFLGVSFYSQGTREQAGSSDQFLVQALETFGEREVGQMSAWDRGERLAELVAAAPTVLVLDGLEPLQYGPGPHDLEGRLKDPGVHALLARLAARPGASLCLVSTRVGLADEDLRTPSLVQKSVEVLSSEAARELLRARGVRGDEAAVCEAVDYLGYHPLALVLAAEYLHTFANGDVARLHEIDLLSEKTKEGRHAKSVMAAYETALRRDGDPVDLELLGLVGLFDRPARWDWVKALAAPPAIPGVTEHLVNTDDRALLESINRLRQWGMLADPGSIETPELDAHPLVREYFGDRLRASHEPGWREAHSRMYDYLTANTREFPDTIEEMEPLYQAVAHGCAAGRHLEALDNVYFRRIIRRNKFFNTKKLGAYGANLGVLTSFFDEPWQQPVSVLNGDRKAFILSQAGFALNALGRLVEAAQPMQTSMELSVGQGNWANAAANSRNLSGLHATLGDPPQALHYARKSIEFSEQSGSAISRMFSKTTLAYALFVMGDLSQAEAVMHEAEEMQKEQAPNYFFLYSLRGFQYCALLLHLGRYDEVLTRATQTLKWVEHGLSLLNEALDYLSLGQAHLLRTRREGTGDFDAASLHLNRAVDGLRQAGNLDELPRGLLARADLHRLRGDAVRARGDLNEAMSIATRGGMRLYQADCHLGYARLCLAEGEREKAREHWRTAKELIGQTGYHLRDGEVEEIGRALGEV